MKDIQDFLSSHDLITLGSIEKKLGLTPGTLRVNRKIPDRYIKPIKDLLNDYGYVNKIDNKNVNNIDNVNKIDKSVVNNIDKSTNVNKIDNESVNKIDNALPYVFMSKPNTVNMYHDGVYMKRYNIPINQQYIITLIH